MATSYEKSEAKDWAKENLKGVCNVILPSFTSDLTGLNEQGIRHDVRRNIELGFTGALLVSECGTTVDEMRQFMEIAVDEAAGRHQILLHGTFDTAEQVIAVSKDAKAIGLDAVLLGYPNSFYPKSGQDIIDYTNTVCDAVDLGVVLFCAQHWNFARVHSSGFPLDAILELCDTENVIAVKYEVGRPGATGTYEAFKAMAAKNVIPSDPFEPNAPIWTDLFNMQWMGTSNYEYYGDRMPKMFAALTEGRREEGLDLYWRTQPARVTRGSEQAAFEGANFIHRYLWKYQAWLTGYNGGPLRQPAMKLSDAQMRRTAEGLVRSQIIDSVPTDFSAFFASRNPA
jgi:dihydrodipicolinate synthase/N-acetylneuraminate lyase